MSISSKSEHDQEMPLVAHLVELRSRILRALLVILLIFIALMPFAQDLYTWVSAPLRAYLPEGATMIATGVASPFLAPFKLTLMLSLFLAVPVILHQVWGFIAPGLYQSEKRIAIPLLISSILLFYIGMAFAFYVVFPIMFGFFASVTPDGVAMMTDIGQYLDFILTLFFAFGVAFEVPVATFLMVWIGILDLQTLRDSRPYVIVGCFVVGMLLTPPDVFSQTLLAIPMWMLFEVGIFAAALVCRSAKHPQNLPSEHL
ncbi:sec-independent protein translocase protein TatC [Azomonas agilis]|uniref:Sec-independent protein translocase protein TatC n=1 Tax=Azomonas agilis TaxID=116849 RepID=A0A562IJR6_9GAMM|nr:sec-independent protein translocase protein TatC [Azomonas agilis]